MAPGDAGRKADTMKKRLLMAAAAAGMLLALAGPAAAEGDHDDPSDKCNSGRGNGSETTPADDCDPGNSGDHNQGGD